MNNVAMMAFATVALSACVNNMQLDNKKAIGMANPASKFCIQQGGQIEIRKNADNSEYGVCHLSNGTIVEEWDFYRTQSKD